MQYILKLQTGREEKINGDSHKIKKGWLNIKRRITPCDEELVYAVKEDFVTDFTIKYDK